MGVGIFSDCIFFLKVNSLSLKEKKKIKNSIILNGGDVSFVLNNKCTHAVVSNPDTLNSSQQKKIEKHLISVVNPDFIWKSVEKEHLGIQLERLDDNKTVEIIRDGDQGYKKNLFQERRQKRNIKETLESNLEEEMEFEDSDCDNIPDGTEVAKYCCFKKDKEYAIVELLCFSKQDSFPFRISTICGLPNTSQKEFTFHLVDTAEKACEKYEHRINDFKNKGFTQINKVPLEAENLASKALKKVLLGEAINVTVLSPEVAGLVESLWVDAVGHLDAILSCPVENISLNDLSKAEGILRQVRNALLKKDREEDIYQMMQEFYRCIPHKEKRQDNINMKFLTVKQDLCQVIRDMINVCETSLSRYTPTSAAKYQALRCRIEHLDPNSEEFHQVKQGILDHNHSNREFNILRIFRVGRMSEANNFKSDVGNVQPLLHASSPCNFVGILSRGLMMPKFIVDEFGGERTDIGNLGSGIYFSDSISTSVKYSQPSDVTGSRLLVICDVALGKCTDVFHRDYTITEAPNGFDSVHGVQHKEGAKSDFTDDEYVVYDVNQVQMRYIVQFSTDGDYVELHKESLYISTDQAPSHSKNLPEQSEDVSVDDLPEQQVTKGGLKGSDGQPIPLESIHVKARLQDLVAQVMIFQTYKNKSSFPIEAKYVFPLDSTAAVCGFEAFINGKHIIGEVKEKQKAHQEYRTAISEGHGAYLMDQDAPDVFTVSVGNLPPQATVIIKITYVMELSYRYNISFSIPGNVAEWQQDKALKENTQDTVETVGIGSDMAPGGSFCLDMSIEMPRKINYISSYTHEINIKRTECKAVIQTKEASSFNDQGFIMVVSMEDCYIPRMWVEKHPDQDSEACMLIFQPDIPCSLNNTFLTICLDCSNSMESCFQSAKQVALLALRSLQSRYVNIVLFGSSSKELYMFPKPPQEDISDMEAFIKKAKPTMGSTEFWKVLQSLCLLTPKVVRQKVVLISDGHVQNENLVFQILSKHKDDIQLFTYGVGTTPNKHMLRCFAQYGSGAFEYFADKSKSRWKDQMEKQSDRVDSSVCTAVSVKWRQFNENPSELLQAPANIQALFDNDSLFVYGFVPYCTQATLKALINNEEFENMVSTTELQKTTGTMLHTLTARALVKDYEDGILLEKENENEMKKQEMKKSIIQLSIDYSIVTQFTSFVAVEKRSAEEDMDIEPNVLEIISAEDVDILPYMDWSSTFDKAESASRSRSPYGSCQVDDDDDDDMGFGLFDGDVELKEASDDLSRGEVYDDVSACLDYEEVCDEASSPIDLEGMPLKSTGAGYKKTAIIVRQVPDEEGDKITSVPLEHLESDLNIDQMLFSGSFLNLLAEDECEKVYSAQMSDVVLARKQDDIADPVCFTSSDLLVNVKRRTARHKKMATSISELSELEKSPPQSTLSSGLFGAALGGSFGSAKRISAQLPSPLTSESASAQLQTISLFQQMSPSVQAAPSADTGFAQKPGAQHSYQFGEPLFLMSSRAPEMSVVGQVASSPSLDSLPMKKSEGHLPQSYKLATDFCAPLTPSYMPMSPQAQPASRFGAVTRSSALSPLSVKSSAQLFPQSHTPAAPLYSPFMSQGLSDERPISSAWDSAPHNLNANVMPTPPPHPLPMGAPGKSMFGFGVFGKSSTMAAVEQKESAQFLPQSLQVGLYASSHDMEDRGSASLFGSAAETPRLPSFEFGVPAPPPPPSVHGDWRRGFGGPPPPPPPVHGDWRRGFGGPPPPPPPVYRDVFPPPPPPLEYRERFRRFGGPPPPPPMISATTQVDRLHSSKFLKKSRLQPAPPSWSSLSSLQSQEGFWLLNQELGTLLKINVSYFTADVLVKKGIMSLGARGIDSIHKLIATLLVLQIIGAHNILGEIKFKTLMKLDLSIPRSLLYPSIDKAIEWAVKCDRQYPGICTRLGLGKDWDQATRQLLGLDPITTTSDLYSVSEFLFLS